MARNRVRKWNEISFTIQAQGRNAPLHPQAPPMIYVSPEERRFDVKHIGLYRRLSVRECAPIQTFPDSFHFVYSNVLNGYKMVGNAVPPRLAKRLAIALKDQLAKVLDTSTITSKRNIAHSILVGYYRSDEQLKLTKEHKIYYVRTGFRHGAMQIPPEVGSPELLLLHKGDNFELFRLNRSNPTVLYREELEKMGFTPHGEVYLAFRIEEALDINHLSHKDEIIQRGKYYTIPFIIHN